MSIVRRLRALTLDRWAGVLLLAYGVGVMAGWVFEWDDVVHLWNPSQLIVFNAALCAALGGAALLVPRAALACAGLVAAIAAVTLLQRAFDMQFGTDLPWLHRWAVGGRAFPGRMNWNTCLALLALAMATAAPHLPKLCRWQNSPAWALALVAWGLADFAGQLLRLDLLFDGYGSVRMSYGNAVAMQVAGLALLWRWRLDGLTGVRPQMSPGRRIVAASAVVLVGMILVTGISTLAFSISRTRANFEREQGERLAAEARRVEALIEERLDNGRNLSARSLMREVLDVASRGAQYPGYSDRLERAARDLVKDGYNSIAIQLTDGRDVVRVGHNAALGTFALELEGTAHSAWLFWADGPVLRQRVPVFIGPRNVGWLVIEERLGRLAEMMADHRMLGRSGVVSLCGLDESMLHCMPGRFNPGVTHRHPVDASGRWLPSALASRGERGTGERLEGRHRVIASWGPIGTTGLGMSLRTETSEIFGEIREEFLLWIPLVILCVGLGISLILTQVSPVVARLRSSERMAVAVNASLMRVTEQLEASDRQLRAITDHVPALIAYIDTDGRYRFANQALQDHFRAARDGVVGRTVREVIGEENFKAVGPHVDQALAGYPCEYERTDACNGRKRHMRAIYIPDYGSDGKVHGFHALVNDVTAAREAAAALRASEERLRTITDSVPVLIGYIDRDLVYRFNNRTYEAWYGQPVTQITGKPVVALIGPERLETARGEIERALAGETVTFEYRMGAPFPERDVRATFVPDRGPDGEIRGVYTVTQDISDSKRVEEELERQARFDTLTGLPNRLLLTERLEMAAARAARDGLPIALLFLDLDKFKDVNDSYGHGAGDAVLKEFGRRLTHCVRRTDTVARLAGDEFVVLLEGLRSRDEAEVVARKIVEAMSVPIDALGNRLVVGTSIGIALHRRAEEEISSLMSRADAALYRAKAAGRNTFAVDADPPAPKASRSAKVPRTHGPAYGHD